MSGYKNLFPDDRFRLNRFSAAQGPIQGEARSGRVLVIQMAKLGDFIQSTPLLANLRRQWPGSAIVLAGEQPAVLEAARLSPLVDETLAAAEGLPAPTGDFEAVYTLNSHLRAITLAAGVKAKARFGPTLVSGRASYTPAQNFLMNLMRLDRRLGRFNLVDVWASLADQPEPSSLVWPEAEPTDLGPADSGLKIGLQLGSKNHLRRWPVEDFVSLTVELARSGLNFSPVLLGSAEERALGLKFKKLLGGRAAEPIDLIGKTDLQQLGEVVSGLDLLISADTGVMHLAAALKTPVLALFFGPAYGPETGPYGPGHLIYQALAPCAPCREGDGCRSRQCLSRPEPLRAARLAENLLGLRTLDQEAAEPWPEGHRVWRTEFDAFGQSLRPLGRPPLDQDEFLALALTEAGREIIRPGYRMRAEQAADLLTTYQCPADIGLGPELLQRRLDAGQPAAGFSRNFQSRALELMRALI